MKLKSLVLRNFRNYTSLEVDFHPKMNIFYGDNAQGKTNLLEAIYLLSIGRSFRTSSTFKALAFNNKTSKFTAAP